MIYIIFAILACSYTKESENKCIYNIIQMLNKNVLPLLDGKLKYHLSDRFSFWNSIWQEGSINLSRTEQEGKWFDPFYGFFIALVRF